MMEFADVSDFFNLFFVFRGESERPAGNRKHHHIVYLIVCFSHLFLAFAFIEFPSNS